MGTGVGRGCSLTLSKPQRPRARPGLPGAARSRALSALLHPSRADTGGMISAALSLRLVAGGQSSVPRAYRAG